MMSKSQRMPWIPMDQMTAAQRGTAAMLGQVSGGTAPA